MKFSKKRKLERIFAAISLVLWFILRHFVLIGIESGKIKERYNEVIYSTGILKTPIYASVILYLGIAIVGWYFSICIREIQYLSKKRRKR